MLPRALTDLEPFAEDWCLDTEVQRDAKRLASSMDEMQALYDAVTPGAEAAIARCDGFPLDAMPDQAVNLMHLLSSMIIVSSPVEAWGQARVPDSGAARLNGLLEPRP